MNVSDIMHLIDACSLPPEVAPEKEVTCGYVCDLLSWVMAHGEEGMAWVTVQTHLNVVAVAALAEMACVILPESIDMPEAILEKAAEEGLRVLKSPLSAYTICGRMMEKGVPEKAE